MSKEKTDVGYFVQSKTPLICLYGQYVQVVQIFIDNKYLFLISAGKQITSADTNIMPVLLCILKKIAYSVLIVSDRF